MASWLVREKQAPVVMMIELLEKATQLLQGASWRLALLVAQRQKTAGWRLPLLGVRQARATFRRALLALQA